MSRQNKSISIYNYATKTFVPVDIIFEDEETNTYIIRYKKSLYHALKFPDQIVFSSQGLKVSYYTYYKNHLIIQDDTDILPFFVPFLFGKGKVWYKSLTVAKSAITLYIKSQK